ncbi:DNA-binding transcription repressor [Basidiobolus ranarum]|uniref:DNA-binding transcription repressor n=1 Tax=Basidiobolus ranarum TaxID=34480 RepID=A0ABR2VXZ6_9FUNG
MTVATEIDIILPKSGNPMRRNKRKGVPVKSPSRFDLETSPGVVFKFPIFFPPSPMKQSLPSPVGSPISSSSSTGEDEIKDKLEGSIILHYPVLLSHVARKRRAKSLDFGVPKTSKTKSSTANANKQRRSSTQLLLDSVSHSNLHDESVSHGEIEPVHHSHEITSPRKSSSVSPGPAGLKKCCASCGVKHTPCWRPGWSDQVPLCNSCGLRYRKTKVYCKHCLYIPLRSELSNNAECRKCFKDLQ